MDDDWMALDYVIEKWAKRKFNWLVDTNSKYINIRVDSRDDHCVVSLRDGTLLKNKVEFDAWFEGCENSATTGMYQRSKNGLCRGTDTIGVINVGSRNDV